MRRDCERRDGKEGRALGLQSMVEGQESLKITASDCKLTVRQSERTESLSQEIKRTATKRQWSLLYEV